MAESVTIHEAKTHFSKLVRRAEAGEEIVVRRGSAPVARIAPLERKHGGVTGRGSMRNEIVIAGDIEQADREIERLFKRSEVFPAATGSRSRGDRSPR
jgi:prevent-host-death family protein